MAGYTGAAGRIIVSVRYARAVIPAQRQEMALRHVQEYGDITNKTYRSLTGVSDMTALRDLDMLVTEGSLRAVGQGRGRRYTL